MTDSGGEEHNDKDGEPTSANGAIADGGDRAGGEGGGRGWGGSERDYDNISREVGWMRNSPSHDGGQQQENSGGR